MIHTAKQLKDKVRNLSKGDNDIAKALIRTFVMERFLERVSLSKYRENFILKGGMLVASIVGVRIRATMDIDTTVKAMPLNIRETEKIVEEIMAVPVEDDVAFKIKSVSTIMEDFDYPGVRIMLEASLGKMRQSVKLDISTDDVITPSAIEYEYRLMFEDRTIRLLTYNIETLLSEKMQTILARGTANTRMRDFYDIFKIAGDGNQKIDPQTLYLAFCATCKKRGTLFSENQIEEILTEISEDDNMPQMWERFRKKNFFVGNLQWEDVAEEVLHSIQTAVSGGSNGNG